MTLAKQSKQSRKIKKYLQFNFINSYKYLDLPGWSALSFEEAED
ncbi:MAG: hypothetical protein ACI843_002132 [Psychrobacter glaciei]|jgi:hypothetical protein